MGSQARPNWTAWNERFDAISVVTYQEGRLFTKVYLKRNVDPAQIIPLLLAHAGCDQNREIAEALGANPASGPAARLV